MLVRWDEYKLDALERADVLFAKGVLLEEEGLERRMDVWGQARQLGNFDARARLVSWGSDRIDPALRFCTGTLSGMMLLGLYMLNERGAEPAEDGFYMLKNAAEFGYDPVPAQYYVSQCYKFGIVAPQSLDIAMKFLRDAQGKFAVDGDLSAKDLVPTSKHSKKARSSSQRDIDWTKLPSGRTSDRLTNWTKAITERIDLCNVIALLSAPGLYRADSM